MNAKEYVKHIGLTEDFDKESASRKMMIVRKLLIHYEAKGTNAIIWLFYKYFFKIFNFSWFPNKSLETQYKGPFKFSEKRKEEFRMRCFKYLSELVNEINDRKLSLDGVEMVLRRPIYDINDVGFSYNGVEIKNDSYKRKHDGAIIRGKKITFFATRNYDTATKNKPIVKAVTHIDFEKDLIVGDKWYVNRIRK